MGFNKIVDYQLLEYLNNYKEMFFFATYNYKNKQNV